MKRNRNRHKASDAQQRDGFANFAARMGIGADNMLSQGTYIPNLLTNNRIQLENIYRGSWIGGKVVDDYAEDMTRAGINITGHDDPSAITNLQRYMTRLDVWTALTDAIRWSRLYGGAAAVMQIDGQDMSKPLRVETVAKDQFKGLVVYDRWQIQADMTRIIQSGPDMGMPEYYRIITSWRGSKASTYGQEIHYSRVMRFVGIKLPFFQAQTQDMWGESVIERLYDRLISYDTATTGAANLVQFAYLRQIGVNGLRDILAAGGKAEENLTTMFDYVRQLQNIMGITLLDKDDTMSYNSYTFSGLDNVLLQFGQQISGASGIPLVRLFGQSPSGMSATGESDIRNYYDTINAQQEAKLRQPIDSLLSVCYRSLFGQSRPADMDFTFAPLWQVSDSERVAMAKTITESVDLALASGTIDATTAARELKQSSELTGVFSNITDEYIADLESEPPAPAIETATISSIGEISDPIEIQKVTMNGAQVLALVDIVAKAANGEIPRESAVQMIETAFPVSRQEAERILGGAGNGFSPSQEPAA